MLGVPQAVKPSLVFLQHSRNHHDEMHIHRVERYPPPRRLQMQERFRIARHSKSLQQCLETPSVHALHQATSPLQRRQLLLRTAKSHSTLEDTQAELVQ